MTQAALSGLAGSSRAVVGVYCKLVLLAEHWRLLGAAADDSGWPEWTGWLLFILLVDKIFVKFFTASEISIQATNIFIIFFKK